MGWGSRAPPEGRREAELGSRTIKVVAVVLGALSLLAMFAISFLPRPANAAAGTGFDSEQIFPGGGRYWEPTVAANWSGNEVYQLVTYLNATKVCSICNGTTIFFRASSDGGSTWSTPKPIWTGNGKVWEYDPHMRVGSDGTIYVVFLDTYNPGTVLFTSKDEGQTWSGPEFMNGNLTWNDYPDLEISPSGKDVFVAFNSKLKSYVAVSHDYGATFAAPVQTNTKSLWYFTNGGTFVPPSAVFPNGAIVFTADGEAPLKQVTTHTLNGPQEITVFVCTNAALAGGCDTSAEWTNTVLDTNHLPPPCAESGCYPEFFMTKDRVAVDSGGTLMMIYGLNSVDQGPKSLYIRTSTDAVHWSAPALVNRLGDSNMPMVVSGPTAGDFRITWMDNRNAECWNCGGLGGWNTWYERTTDGGKSWSQPVQLSDLAFGAPYKGPSGFTMIFGDYFGFADNSAGKNFVIWGESDGTSLYCCGSSWFTRGA